MKPLHELSKEELYALNHEVYEQLASATTDHLAAKQQEAEVRHELELQIAYAIYDGTIQGKNEKEREAIARQLFPDHFAAAETARKRTWETETALQIAKLKEAELAMGVRIFDFVTR